jgi:hypothetical protein
MLKKFFDTHVRWLTETALGCPPGGDVKPILSYADADLRWSYEPLPDAAAIPRILRNAAYYAVVQPCWTFDDPETYRREGYTVTAGDKDDTLAALFLVERAPDGSIAALHRQPQTPLGPLVNLLRR